MWRNSQTTSLLGGDLLELVQHEPQSSLLPRVGVGEFFGSGAEIVVGPPLRRDRAVLGDWPPLPGNARHPTDGSRRGRREAGCSHLADIVFPCFRVGGLPCLDDHVSKLGQTEGRVLLPELGEETHHSRGTRRRAHGGETVTIVARDMEVIKVRNTARNRSTAWVTSYHGAQDGALADSSQAYPSSLGIIK